MVDKLPLPDAKRWLVYDAIVQALQSDPDLKRVVRPSSWHTFSGRPQESAEFGSSGYPCIAITPAGAAASPETPVTQSSPMALKIDVAVPGLSVRNLFALWEAIERAAFAGDGRNRAFAALQAACPKVVGLKLGQPAITPIRDGTDAGHLAATGTVEIALLV